ncbi:hypothetical protein QCA50_004305 [Cerrena zonata]|uniref:Uncharacterized protein n=1 Tax=Cerrena zonata TaxID=2478898 RepID=A0AAW0GL64_9APHY
MIPVCGLSQDVVVLYPSRCTTLCTVLFSVCFWLTYVFLLELVHTYPTFPSTLLLNPAYDANSMLFYSSSIPSSLFFHQWPSIQSTVVFPVGVFSLSFNCRHSQASYPLNTTAKDW